MEQQQTLDLFSDQPQAEGDPLMQTAMSSSQLEAAAQELYQSGQTVRPSWGQLSDVTRSVWREYAQRIEQGVPDPFSVCHQDRLRG